MHWFGEENQQSVKISLRINMEKKNIIFNKAAPAKGMDIENKWLIAVEEVKYVGQIITKDGDKTIPYNLNKISVDCF